MSILASNVSRRSLFALGVGVILTTGCAAVTNTSAESTKTLTCDQDFTEILLLLGSGVPTYDYDPAVDLHDLIAHSDAITTGLLDAVTRSTRRAGIDDGEATTVSTTSHRVLLTADGSVGEIPDFAYTSFWADSSEPDPLAEEVAFEGVTFVAFLLQAGTQTGDYHAKVQGLFISCEGSPEGSVPIQGPLPPDAAGASISELVELVEADRDAARSGLDGQP